MSQYLHDLACPQCGSLVFRLEDWATYISVLCTGCGHKAGELERHPHLPKMRKHKEIK